MSLKKIYYLLAVLLIGSSLFFVSCDNEDEEDLLGDWEEGSDFDGVPRSESVGFVIGNYGYLATGINLDKDRLKDLWYYNSDENYWVQRANMPNEAIARSAAVAFAAGNKGYVGTGINDNGDELKDFWCYDPATNLWSKIDDFPGSARYSAVAFAINDKGYVGTGYDDNGETKDFYEYDPVAGSWEQIIYNGSKRYDACAFVIGTKAYFLTGSNNQSTKEEFWVFDGTTKKWTQLRDIADTNADEKYDDDYTSIVRVKAVAFSVKGKGYLATGSNTSTVSNVWEYNPATDLWIEKTSFQGGARTESVGFGIGNYGYIATGRNSSSYFFEDLAIFDPNAEDDEKY